MVVFSHPTGNANSKAAAIGLYDADLLSALHTSIASFPDSVLDSVSSISAFSEIRRRQFDPRLKHHTIIHPWHEFSRLAALKAGLSKLTQHETGFFCIDKIYQNIDNHVSASLKAASAAGVKAVYGYEDAALSSFKKAKQLNLQCLYDLPIGYWRTARTLLEAERDKWPEWSQTLTGFKDSIEKLKRKDEELLLADKIYVASSFTAQTLQDFPGKLAPVEVIPYGFPPVGPDRSYDGLADNRPLKLLFVGGLSQRKGIANLFAAVKKFKKHVTLTIVGGKTGEQCDALDNALANHTWMPSLPHHNILSLMRQHDVLVFPSLFEGFGLVITEAMSQGTPVITTYRTAGKDLIEHGENGWLVEAGSTTAIEEAIEAILLNPEILAKMGNAAMVTTLLRPWSVYSSRLAASISTHLSTQKSTSNINADII